MSTANDDAASKDEYEVVHDAHAERDLDRIPSADFETVDDHIQGLAKNPRPNGVVKLDGRVHRIRVGDWRVIYVIDDKAKRVIISRVKRREKDTYRRGW